MVPSIQQQLWLPSFEYLQFSNEWYRLFTVALTHGGFLHLGFNMYSLMVLGNPLEAAFGKQKLLIVFFFSLLTGSLTSAYFASVYGASVGASGAIFGLFGALAIVGKRIGADIRSIVVIIGINFVIGGLNKALDGIDSAAGPFVNFGEIPKVKIPRLSEGGIVTSPTLAMIAEGGESEAVIPLSKLGNLGGGITINVSGALDPSAVARQIRQLLTQDAARLGLVNPI